MTSATALHRASSDGAAELLGDSARSVDDDIHMTEALAALLNINFPLLRSWRQDFPAVFRAGWQDGADPFDTHSMPLRLTAIGPMWQQRQQLFMVLTYHYTMMALFRPFHRFSPV